MFTVFWPSWLFLFNERVPKFYYMLLSWDLQMSLIGTANNLIIDIRWQSYFYIGFLLGKHFHFHFEQAIRDGFFFLFFFFCYNKRWLYCTPCKVRFKSNKLFCPYFLYIIFFLPYTSNKSTNFKDSSCFFGSISKNG